MAHKLISSGQTRVILRFVFFNFVLFIPSDYFSVAIMFHGTGQLSRNAGRRLLPCECFSDWKKRSRIRAYPSSFFRRVCEFPSHEKLAPHSFPVRPRFFRRQQNCARKTGPALNCFIDLIHIVAFDGVV